MTPKIAIIGDGSWPIAITKKTCFAYRNAPVYRKTQVE